MLGVFVTLLLMLLIVPMIWRRVVRLTRKRMMAEMPMSYSELHAEKDQVRAEMAIDLRKQEVIANRRQDELANKTIRINRLNKTVEERDAQIATHLETIEDLNQSLADQKGETGRVSGLLQTSEQQLANARKTITDLEETRDQLEKDIYYLETNIDEQKVELAAQMARIENLREEISSLRTAERTDRRARQDRNTARPEEHRARPHQGASVCP
jgi:chromosome segregation ATPase